MRILIADDDPQLVRALRITLTAHGYDVDTAANGAEAVTLAARTTPDIVMLDLGMPTLDGIEVITALRRWTSAPILVVSGRTGSADKVDPLDAGAPEGTVGNRSGSRQWLSATLRLAAAQEARGTSRAPGTPADRSGNGVPPRRAPRVGGPSALARTPPPGVSMTVSGHRGVMGDATVGGRHASRCR